MSIWLIAFALLYSIIVIPSWNLGHLDFGDGNYMYIGWRVSQGAVLYRDILAPQPPVHLYLGAALAWIGRTLPAAICPHPLYVFRAYSLIIHLATMVLIYFTALRLWGRHPAGHHIDDNQVSPNSPLSPDRASAIVAALIYMLLPIGFWWTLGYQSEPTEMLFLIGSFLALLRWSTRGAFLAGALAAFGPLCNMTASVYVLFMAVWLLVRRPRLFLPFIVPVVAIIGAVTIGMELYTHAYIENVIQNQVGSFPRRQVLGPGATAFGYNVNAMASRGGFWAPWADFILVLSYALGKWASQGAKILNLEGGYVLFALLGIVCWCRRNYGVNPDAARRAATPTFETEFVAWYSILMLGSLAFVAKGGTMDYIFSIGEPFVAIFAGGMLVLFYRTYVRGVLSALRWRDLSPAAAIFAALVFLLALTWNGLSFCAFTLRQQQYELPAPETQTLVRAIQRYCPPDGLILSPPHYAFVAQRRIAEDYSELLLWSLKYANERVDKSPARGVATVERIAKLLDQKKISYIVLDTGQTGRIPEITKALEANYEQVPSPFAGGKMEYQTLNVLLKFYRPKA